MDEIYTRLNAVFREIFDDDRIIVTPDLTAEDISEWDSLNHIRLMLAVQKTFGAKFAAAEISNLKNVADLVKLIQAKSVAA